MKTLPASGLFLFLSSSVLAQSPLPSAALPEAVHYDGADWHLRGEGVVCCPCQVPCPCRTNGNPSYGHCEASLYLRIREGHYAAINLNNLQLVQTSGSCAMDYQKLAALYFDAPTTPEQQLAFMKLTASFFSSGAAEFPYVRTVPIDAQITHDHLFRISIPDILQMWVDRNWGQPAAPLPMVAATDYFSNALQYAQNIRYRLHDDLANVNFDYSNRQANYRTVDLDVSQYRSRSMLVQHLNESGWFNEAQMRLIHEQHLALPDLETIRKEVSRLRWAQGKGNETRRDSP